MFVADRRFPTSNTNLAVCLAALRIPIKIQDPVYVVEETHRPQRPCEQFRRSITSSYKPFSSSFKIACIKTLAPFATSEAVVNSFGEWLIPPTLGTKIMPIGTIRARS